MADIEAQVAQATAEADAADPFAGFVDVPDWLRAALVPADPLDAVIEAARRFNLDPNDPKGRDND